MSRLYLLSFGIYVGVYGSLYKHAIVWFRRRSFSVIVHICSRSLVLDRYKRRRYRINDLSTYLCVDVNTDARTGSRTVPLSMRISRYRVGRIALCFSYLLRSTFIRLVGYSQSLTIRATFDGHDNRATRILYAFSTIKDFDYIVNCNRRKWLTPVKLAKEKPNSIIEESRIRPPPKKVGFYVSLSLRSRVQLRITILFGTVVESERTRSAAICSVASQSSRSHSNFGARARLLF